MIEKQEHPQAKWLRAIADGETLQAKYIVNDVWADLSHKDILSLIAVDNLSEYVRIKPRTITIGKYEVAEPMKVAPAYETPYFIFSGFEPESVRPTSWGGGISDSRALQSGMCWLKREDAELAAKAISELLRGVML